MTVRALFFDVFGTLVDWRTGVARDAEALLSRSATPSTGSLSRTRGAPNTNPP